MLLKKNKKDMNIKIEIKEKQIIKTATKIYIPSITLTDGTAEIAWLLLDNNSAVLDGAAYRLTPEEYNTWGTDDSHIINIVLREANATLS